MSYQKKKHKNSALLTTIYKVTVNWLTTRVANQCAVPSLHIQWFNIATLSLHGVTCHHENISNTMELVCVADNHLYKICITEHLNIINTHYLSKLMRWWCWPPALPRPLGCFLCLPVTKDWINTLTPSANLMKPIYDLLADKWNKCKQVTGLKSGIFHHHSARGLLSIFLSFIWIVIWQYHKSKCVWQVAQQTVAKPDLFQYSTRHHKGVPSSQGDHSSQSQTWGTLRIQ
jgi:hypothetical protein